MKIRVLPSALDDLADGFSFYESHEKPACRQAGDWGAIFLRRCFLILIRCNCMQEFILISWPHVFGYHRLLSKRFPYAVYYSKEAKTVFVNAVLDCRRNPDWIRTRLDEPK